MTSGCTPKGHSLKTATLTYVTAQKMSKRALVLRLAVDVLLVALATCNAYAKQSTLSNVFSHLNLQ